MVVHLQDTLVTNRTVMRSLRLIAVALSADELQQVHHAPVALLMNLILNLPESLVDLAIASEEPA